MSDKIERGDTLTVETPDHTKKKSLTGFIRNTEKQKKLKEQQGFLPDKEVQNQQNQNSRSKGQTSPKYKSNVQEEQMESAGGDQEPGKKGLPAPTRVDTVLIIEHEDSQTEQRGLPVPVRGDTEMVENQGQGLPVPIRGDTEMLNQDQSQNQIQEGELQEYLEFNFILNVDDDYHPAQQDKLHDALARILNIDRSDIVALEVIMEDSTGKYRIKGKFEKRYSNIKDRLDNAIATELLNNAIQKECNYKNRPTIDNFQSMISKLPKPPRRPKQQVEEIQTQKPVMNRDEIKSSSVSGMNGPEPVDPPSGGCCTIL